METITQKPFSAKQISGFWISFIAFIALFYEQNLGLNLFIFSILLQLLVFIFNRNLFTLHNVQIYSALIIITSASAAWFGDDFSCIFTILLLLQYHSIIFDVEKKLIYTPIKTFWNNIKTYVFAFTLPIFGYKTQGIFRQNKWFYYFIFPIIAIILFIVLYSFINQDFATLFQDISFDFLDFGFIFFCCFGVTLLLPFWFYHRSHTLDNLGYANYTNENFNKNSVQNFIKNPNEILQKSGLIVMSILTALLVLLLVFDFMQIANNKKVIAESSYSIFVHNGVAAVIFSIVFVVLIIGFYFQGKLNFNVNNTLKNIVYTWLILNALLLLSTFLKNKIYIDACGLTLKRVGVIAFLILSLIGLFVTFLKIKLQKTNYFIINKMLWVFVIFFTLICPINWSNIITNHNIKAYKENKVYLDLIYLYSLPHYNYKALQQFEKERNTTQSFKKIYENQTCDFQNLQNNIFREYNDRMDYRSTAFYYDFVVCHSSDK